MNILFRRDIENLSLDKCLEKDIRHALEKIGEMYALKNAEVSITLTNDAQIHEINKNYRHVDKPTDVISFALQESVEPLITDGPAINMLGDIIISVERARIQASDYGHSLRRELVFLTVHGMLHLLGYDHQEKNERHEMEEEQRRIMKILGISRNAKEEDKVVTAEGK
ncbi:rRNA maturation RNase YbeY [Selenomonas sputigena]|uniref:rRNA maturation RNase YbeY n=1 Tax=Selenomonas sputigena TaxID=69823 RepID=UPI003F664A20